MPTIHQHEAEAVRRRFLAEAGRIRRDEGRSDAWKKERITDLWRRAGSDIARLRAAERQERADRRVALERRLFGAPRPSGYLAPGEEAAGVAAYRAALGLAFGLTGHEDGRAMLQVAELTGDGGLARAVAAVGYLRAWPGVTERYAADREDVRAGLAELAELRTAEDDAAQRFTRSIAFTLPERLAEVDPSVPAGDADEPGLAAAAAA